jgi:drug/metabolite transporter (DMT)-like permease
MHIKGIDRSDEPGRRMVTGVIAAAVTVLIWSLWIVTTRQAATVHLPAAWLAITRFAVPAVALAPFWWRLGLLPRGVPVHLMAMMVLGAGAPYFVLVATGMHYASAAESGVLLGGTMPLFAALFSATIDRERFGASRIAGFALVVIAMAAIGGLAVVHGQGAGRLLLVVGAALWAIYTLAYRRSGLAALPAAGIIAAWSTILVLPFALMEGTTALFAAGPGVLAGEVLSQGVLSGIVALACYGTAVRILGSSRAALIATLPPAVAAVLAIPMLGEVPAPMTLGGVALVVVGVALATGAVKLGRRRAVASGT